MPCVPRLTGFKISLPARSSITPSPFVRPRVWQRRLDICVIGWRCSHQSFCWKTFRSPGSHFTWRSDVKSSLLYSLGSHTCQTFGTDNRL
ncbi:hypothetical protein MPTK1_7g16070 [Marchantia polymorpha subsp. ruderalis]|uniref:Uncharacterized protein n=2 Tax=Marchantia polymorpha TaxID=3197 RepID=A0AAF6C068_MARPO|nr:hypothetical protein MARPO_0111s0013 [Marchantia polymorpha]BBN17652.1 hypothetical protein Mp_7g16070 [Marchantia polymorpha subsp. ruderalis]|eukprot:PTQ31452.1 hypothetical protein MARPO_0111s0013 [Marchantia polymorpha]